MGRALRALSSRERGRQASVAAAKAVSDQGTRPSAMRISLLARSAVGEHAWSLLRGGHAGPDPFLLLALFLDQLVGDVVLQMLLT